MEELARIFLKFLISSLIADELVNIAKRLAKILTSKSGEDFSVKEEDLGLILKSLKQIEDVILEKTITKEADISNPELLKICENKILQEAIATPEIVKRTRLFLQSIYTEDWVKLCRFLVAQGLYSDAKDFYEGYTKAFKENNIWSFWRFSDLGNLYISMGLFDKADDSLNKALTLAKTIPEERLRGESRKELLSICHSYIGGLHRRKKELGKAIEEMTKAVELLPFNSTMRMQFLNNLVVLLILKGRLEEAELKQQELEIFYSKEGEAKDKYYIVFLTNKAKLYVSKNEIGNAELSFLESEKLARKLVKQSTLSYTKQDFARHLSNIGDFYEFKPNPDLRRSENYYLEALKIITNIFGEHHQITLEIMQKLKWIQFKRLNYLSIESNSLET